jgi:urea transport system ATP-binding protein
MLTITELHASYGRSTVLHGIDMTVAPDGVTAVLGHNGAGKSTLLRVAIGLLRPVRGTVHLDGEDITRLPAHQRVARGMAYVPQGQQCFPHLTALENLQLTADTRRGGRAGIDDALDLFPALKPLLRRRAGLLSGGQRQQLGIARALITRPRLLLLDEPTEGIQPTVVAEIEQRILDLSARVAVFLVEQHLGFALRAARHYHVLESGRVTATGSSDGDSVERVRAALSV